jgi:hypothetical protein
VRKQTENAMLRAAWDTEQRAGLELWELARKLEEEKGDGRHGVGSSPGTNWVGV